MGADGTIAGMCYGMAWHGMCYDTAGMCYGTMLGMCYAAMWAWKVRPMLESRAVKGLTAVSLDIHYYQLLTLFMTKKQCNFFPNLKKCSF